MRHAAPDWVSASCGDWQAERDCLKQRQQPVYLNAATEGRCLLEMYFFLICAGGRARLCFLRVQHDSFAEAAAASSSSSCHKFQQCAQTGKFCTWHWKKFIAAALSGRAYTNAAREDASRLPRTCNHELHSLVLGTCFGGR